MFDVGFVNSDTYEVYDGAHIEFNCTDINEAQYSYNCAVLAQGAAYMYNYVCVVVCRISVCLSPRLPSS